MPLQLRCWTLLRIAPLIELSAEQRTTLEAWANGRKSQVRVADRARVVLLAAEGKQSWKIVAIDGLMACFTGGWPDFGLRDLLGLRR
jgi:hypothetical protein